MVTAARCLECRAVDLASRARADIDAARAFGLAVASDLRYVR
jgi:hypothetical protein